MKKLLLFVSLALMFFCYANLLKADVQVLFDEEEDFLKKAAFGFTAGCNVENEGKLFDLSGIRWIRKMDLFGF